MFHSPKAVLKNEKPEKRKQDANGREAVEDETCHKKYAREVRARKIFLATLQGLVLYGADFGHYLSCPFTGLFFKAAGGKMSIQKNLKEGEEKGW
jgi:hypothetical protein